MSKKKLAATAETFNDADALMRKINESEKDRKAMADIRKIAKDFKLTINEKFL